MTIITRYVVEHKGVEKFVTTDKKEADKYDKMLEVADNLSEYIGAKGLALEANVLEELSILLAKNKDSLGKLFRGIDAQSLLSEESAEVVALGTKQA
jgi:dsDNA-binding SOS-regulon protein